MSYNPDTGRIRCDVCGSEVRYRRYIAYQRAGGKRVWHICQVCRGFGAYWCRDCQDVHRRPGTCPHQPLPEPGEEAPHG